MSRNVICDYFTKSDTDAGKAKCSECSKLLSLGSDKPERQTVHELKSHLEQCHKQVSAVYTEKVSARKAEPPTKKATLDEQLNAQPKRVQLSIPALKELHVSNKWPHEHSDVQRNEKSIMDRPRNTLREILPSYVNACNIRESCVQEPGSIVIRRVQVMYFGLSGTATRD